MSEEKNVVEIIEAIEPQKVEIPVEVIDGLDANEKRMAEKVGILKAEEPAKKEEKAATEKVEEAKTKDGETQLFEDTEKNEQALLKNYNKNEQALYFKWKSDKQARQNAQRDAELATIREKALKKELEGIKNADNLSSTKLKKINELLSGNADEITVEALQAIINEQPKKEDDKNRPLTLSDLEKLQEENKKKKEEEITSQKEFQKKVAEVENFGKVKFGEEYDSIISQAQEVLEGKVELPSYIDTKYLSTRLVEAISKPDADFEAVTKYVIDIAKLNPNFGQAKKEVPASKESSQKKETNENINRILNNANKQKTSASVGAGGNGRRLVSYEDLTIADAAKLSNDEYRKLPADVRERLRKEASQI